MHSLARVSALSLVAVGLVALAACSSSTDDEPGVVADAGTSSGTNNSSSSSSSSGGSSSSSSSSGALLDGSVPSDGGGDAGDFALELANRTLAVEFDRRARCDALPTPTAAQAAAYVAAVHEQLTRPGLTPAYLAAWDACMAQPFPCFGFSQACLAMRAQVGTLTLGAACQQDAQCETGACSGNDLTCGECVASVGLEQSCAGALRYRCAAGLACDGLVCKPLRSVGENESCDDNNAICQPELQCVATALNQLCRTSPAPGVSCRSASLSLDCAQGNTHYCDSTTNVCELRPVAGGSCGVQACAGGLVCERTSAMSSTCRAPRTDVALDAACWPGDSCVAGASCERKDPATGIEHCALEAPAGAPCGAAVGGCANGLVCDAASQLCAPRSPVCP